MLNLVLYTMASASTGKALTNLLAKTPIRTGLKKDDKVVLAKVQGGNKYLVLDKVENPRRMFPKQSG